MLRAVSPPEPTDAPRSDPVAAHDRERAVPSIDPVAAGVAAWPGLCAAFALAALVGWWAPRTALDWQPGLALTEPWRWWTPVAVHLSALHLAANLLGCAVIAWLGWAAALPWRVVLAWLAAWPLTHLALGPLAPDLAHYAGLSGVLHAGVAAAGLHLVLDSARGSLPASAARSRRRIGALILAVLAIKLVVEQPWGAPARAVAGWDIAIAPIAHTTGAIAGVLLAALAEAWARRTRSRRPAAVG